MNGQFLIALTLMGVVALYAYKCSLHFRLLQLNIKGKKKSDAESFWKNWSDAKARKKRMEALMMYPLFFPVTFEEKDTEAHKSVKIAVKRMNIVIYWLLIILLFVAVYLGKSAEQ